MVFVVCCCFVVVVFFGGGEAGGEGVSRLVKYASNTIFDLNSL